MCCFEQLFVLIQPTFDLSSGSGPRNEYSYHNDFSVTSIHVGQYKIWAYTWLISYHVRNSCIIQIQMFDKTLCIIFWDQLNGLIAYILFEFVYRAHISVWFRQWVRVCVCNTNCMTNGKRICHDGRWVHHRMYGIIIHSQRSAYAAIYQRYYHHNTLTHIHTYTLQITKQQNNHQHNETHTNIERRRTANGETFSQKHIASF